MRMVPFRFLKLASLIPVLFLGVPKAFGQGCDHHDFDSPELRQRAHQSISWRHPDFRRERTERIRLIAFNDFHGQIGTGKFVSGRPVGSAPVLAAYFHAAA